ncbi:uncharacterized protein [Haliotis asinina]|uniref:uncharacterized protein n=1 Tax=Haliotis asinina TaxID=109174 RepID=UPI0035320592
MSSLRSSVRPKSSKQKWGTILKPEFGLGYQKLTKYEIAQTVNRLNTVPSSDDRAYERFNKKMSQAEIEEMIKRVSKTDADKIPDSDRRLQKSIYTGMGIVSSYAWKGYN